MGRISDSYSTGLQRDPFANLGCVTSPRSAEGRYQGQATRSKTSGVVSYRLARQRVVDAVLKGDRPTETVCDAQPELETGGTRLWHIVAGTLPYL